LSIKQQQAARRLAAGVLKISANLKDKEEEED
jgi:hypothetical protein